MSGVMVLKCRVCGVEVQNDEQQCFNCIEQEAKVQVLTSEEKQGFHGITLVQDQEKQEKEYYESENLQGNQRIYSKQFSLVNTSFLTKLIIGIIILGIVFIALPVAILVISIISVILYFFRR